MHERLLLTLGALVSRCTYKQQLDDLAFSNNATFATDMVGVLLRGMPKDLAHPRTGYVGVRHATWQLSSSITWPGLLLLAEFSKNTIEITLNKILVLPSAFDRIGA
jgi:hypothetical protein